MVRMVAVVAVAALCAAPAGLSAQTAPGADPREANLTAYVDLLRSDVRALKSAILTELMEFTDAEDVAFWPIYREYDLELSKLNDERIAMIKEYAANYGTVSDALADSLARKAIDVDRRRAGLLEKYYDRVKASLSSRAAIRFLQVEHQLLLLIDLQIAAALPVVK